MSKKKALAIASIVLAAVSSVVLKKKHPHQPPPPPPIIMGLPALPALTVDTSPFTPTGSTIVVGAGGDFQAALNSASPGDLITLASGATYTGNFSLPVKAGSTYITVQTAGFSATGRMSIAGAANLAKIRTTIASPAIASAIGAHHFRFIGVEVYSSGVSIDTLIPLGDGSETSLAQQPHHIILDRCYIHGDPTLGGKRGVGIQGSYLAVIDSYLSDWKGNGFDTQAICGWSAAGPLKVENNYIEGAGENMLIGGADTAIANLTPSDITVRNNYFFKPLSWKIGDPSYAGTPWTIKNSFELKHAQRVLVEGNTFENNWAQAQNGMTILFTPRNSSNTNPWTVVQDVTFRRNVIKNVDGGLNILGSDDAFPSQTTKRILIENNLWQPINVFGVYLYLLSSPAEDITINHDTSDSETGSCVLATGIGGTMPRFTFTNNIARHNSYGVLGDADGVGSACLATYFPGAIFSRNIIIGANPSQYPADNFYPTDISSVGFVNYPTNLNLNSTSLYYHQGTDGTSPGVQQQQQSAGLPSGQMLLSGVGN